MYWRMYRMSFRRRSGTEVKTPRAMTSRLMWGGGVPRPFGNFDCTNRDPYRRGG